jgi:anti-sigma regulatory factor (Ser/Thr protein kinase)
MTIELESTPIASGEHAVKFYDDEAELAVAVGAYVADAAAAGAAAVVIATETHQRAFEAELEAIGIDPAQAADAGTLIFLDAASMLASFMPGGQIDREAFRWVVGTVLRRAARGGRAVHAYGEMVALLWDAGDVLAAIELERCWNDLAQEHEFALLCAYRSASVAKPEHARALQQVCHLHSSVHGAPRRSEISRRFPAKNEAPRAARRFVAEALTRWGVDGPSLDDARLVLSELTSNAVVHARSPFSVVIRPEGSRVRIAVHDTSRVRPTVRNSGVMGTSGRGLRLVAALAVDWGVDVTADGKTVWATMAL